MDKMLAWITRPSSHEILMGGDRHLLLWMERPHYSHAAKASDLCLRSDPRRYRDRGWIGRRDQGVRAKPLLKQCATLRAAVWDEVFLSVCPKGMTLGEGQVWSETQRGNEVFDGMPITLWHQLTDDRDWEGKCNVSHKRFLLEVDLLSQTVRRVTPLVALRRTTEEEALPGVVESDSIDPALAVEVWHTAPDPDRMPF